MQAATKNNSQAAGNAQEAAMTGYEIAKRVNAELVKAELKPIPPQMVYNYMRQGFIARGDEPAQIAWIEKYVAKRIGRAASVRAVQRHCSETPWGARTR